VTYAIDYVRRTPGISTSFEVSNQLLEDFRIYLSEKRIHPGIAEWSSERAFVRNRLQTEIFTQAFGVEKGDEIEARRDPLIQRALDSIGAR
jgi:carboxyl-terminal processing protease